MQHPVKFGGTPASIRAEPPLLGQHTAEVLDELGFSPEEIARMTKAHQG
jgi:crotonobetainyl-CoA:carnitine CoA-transferase CaiB-like acyl-CoA transferase